MSFNARRASRVVLGYFFRGLLLLVPITVIVWALWRLLAYLDSIIPTDIPGLGILILLAIITVSGWLGSTIIFQPLAEIGDEVLQKVPVIKTMYGALKDMMEALVGSKRKFDRPVMVRLGAGMDAYRLGFITQEDLEHLGIASDMVAVYLPHAFAWSGNLVVVPRANVKPLGAEPADVMKFVVSGGVSKVADE